MIAAKTLVKVTLVLSAIATLAPIVVRTPNHFSQAEDKKRAADDVPAVALARGQLYLNSNAGKKSSSQRSTSSGDSECVDPTCYHYLTAAERARWQRCTHKTARSGADGPLRGGRCRFMNGTGRAGPVALASFPGSGNTWIRCLLEKATGICTGAVYCDVTLRGNNYSGEGVNGSSVIAVKTHATHPKFIGQNDKIGSQVFASAIVILRNPQDAIISDWNRRNNKRTSNDSVSNHVLSVGPEMFGQNTVWSERVPPMAQHWSTQVTSWLIEGKGHRLLTVRYEDVKVDPIGEIGKMLDFLGVPFTVEELSQRLAGSCGGFKRPQLQRTDFQHYTPQQKDFIHQTIEKTIQTLREANIEEVKLLTGYLDTGRD